MIKKITKETIPEERITHETRERNFLKQFFRDIKEGYLLKVKDKGWGSED